MIIVSPSSALLIRSIKASWELILSFRIELEDKLSVLLIGEISSQFRLKSLSQGISELISVSKSPAEEISSNCKSLSVAPIADRDNKTIKVKKIKDSL